MKMRLDEKGVEAARKATALQFPGTWMDEMCLTFTRSYLSALAPAEVGGLVERLNIKAGIIEMGERIAWGSDTAIMREAATALEAQEAELSSLRMMADSKVVSHRDFNTVRSEKSEASLASERAAHAETKRELDEAMKALPFVVQYRRTDAGVRWNDMAAFDTEGPAERYCQSCAETTSHWEYRVDRRIREGGKVDG